MSGRQRLCLSIARAAGCTVKRPHLRKAEKASWVRVMRDEVDGTKVAIRVILLLWLCAVAFWAWWRP